MKVPFGTDVVSSWKRRHGIDFEVEALLHWREPSATGARLLCRRPIGKQRSQGKARGHDHLKHRR